MGGTTADNPQDGVGGIDKQQLALFVEKGVLVVGEKIAQELGPPRHAQGLETVALAPMAEREGENNFVGIEKRSARRQLIPMQGMEIEVLGANNAQTGEGLTIVFLQRMHKQALPVEQGVMGWRVKMAARLGSRENILGGSVVEAIGPKQLVEQLGAAFRKGELETHPNGAIGPKLDQLGAQRLHKGIVEPFERLQVHDSLRQSSVGRRLHLPQEREHLMTDLVAPILKRSIGEILNMLQPVPSGIGFYLLAAEGKERPCYIALQGQDAM